MQTHPDPQVLRGRLTGTQTGPGTQWGATAQLYTDTRMWQHREGRTHCHQLIAHLLPFPPCSPAWVKPLLCAQSCSLSHTLTGRQHVCTHTHSHTHVQTHSGLSETPAGPVWVVDSPVHAQASEKGYGRVWGMGRTQPARCQVWEFGFNPEGLGHPQGLSGGRGGRTAGTAGSLPEARRV